VTPAGFRDNLSVLIEAGGGQVDHGFLGDTVSWMEGPLPGIRKPGASRGQALCH
jgi:hypothetical protein